MNVLVTGAAGFIGSHLCERLLAGGVRVIGLDNFDGFYDPAVKRTNLRAASANPGFTLVEGDIRDGARVEELLEGEGIECLVHLAARAGVRPSIQDPLLYESVNVHGTAVLLEACRKVGLRRFVFASSSSVYGNNEKVPFSEEDRVDHPISPYAATKKAGELLCYTYHALFGIDVACLRFFTVYGPRQRPEMAIHKFTRLLSEGKPIPLFGDGSSRRDYTYIDDILDGVVKVLDRLEGYEIYNLGESRTVALRELVDLIASELGVVPVTDRRPEQPGDVRVTYADVGKARERLGYAPSVPIEEGIRRFVAWFRGQGGGGL